MDARIDPAKALGLEEGDAHVIRNAGGLVNDETLRSLVISHHLLGTQEAIVIGHTDCGMVTFTNDDLHAKLGPESESIDFQPFPDVDARVRAERRDDPQRAAAPRLVRGDRVRLRRDDREDRTRSRTPAVASSVISGTPASAFETGQFAFAPCAASSKPAASRPGTRPSTVSAIFVIPSPGWKVTVAEVSSCSGGVPAFASPAESAIEKHEACAAAISSSGLVLPPAATSSERAAQLTRLLADRAARRRADRAAPVHQAALPGHICTPVGRHRRLPRSC